MSGTEWFSGPYGVMILCLCFYDTSVTCTNLTTTRRGGSHTRYNFWSCIKKIWTHLIYIIEILIFFGSIYLRTFLLFFFLFVEFKCYSPSIFDNFSYFIIERVNVSLHMSTNFLLKKQLKLKILKLHIYI